MARILSQTLIRSSSPLRPNLHSPPKCSLSSRFICFRNKFHSESQLIEINLDGDSESEGDFGVALRKLDEAIYGIVVRQSAPAWLPFVPGSSYCVPPRPKAGSLRILDMVEKMTNPMSDEELLSFTSPRGWPSSQYFVQETILKETLQSEDDDGQAVSDKMAS